MTDKTVSVAVGLTNDGKILLRAASSSNATEVLLTFEQAEALGRPLLAASAQKGSET